jgi:parallel beta-helix repeat protein
MLRLFAPFPAILLFATAAGAATLVVNPQGTGDLATIQAAVDSAGPGDIIELVDGTYTGTGNRDIDFLGKTITVRSQSGNPEACVIDCEQLGRGIFFHSGEGAGASLVGVTVTNGFATGADNLERSGGGLHCRYSSSPTITNCIFSNNRADYAGGGIALAHSASPSINDCEFSENSAQYGAGLFAIDQCAPVITNALFRHGSAVQHGGGIYCYTSFPVLSFCTFSGNSAYFGAAIDSHESSVVDLVNCTLTSNTSGFGGVIRSFGSSLNATNTIIAFSGAPSEAVYCVGVGGSATLACCNIYGNAGGDWVGCIQDQLGINHNLSSDPVFCSAAPDDDMNWTLQSDSPCAPGHSECGLIGAWNVGCSISPVRKTSWGRIKALYSD